MLESIVSNLSNGVLAPTQRNRPQYLCSYDNNMFILNGGGTKTGLLSDSRDAPSTQKLEHDSESKC